MRLTHSILFISFAASASTAAAQRPNFSGRWRLTGTELKSGADNGHDGRGRLPPARLVVTQSPESVTVLMEMVDSAEHSIASTGRLTYRRGSDWTGRHNSPPGSTAKTHAPRWRENGRVLELSRVTVWSRRDGKGEGRHTIDEIWRLAADGTLRRHVHQVTPGGKIERIETWTRARGTATTP